MDTTHHYMSHKNGTHVSVETTLANKHTIVLHSLPYLIDLCGWEGLH